MKRLPNWRSQLNALIEQRRRDKEYDCGLFVADCIAAMTGTDLAASYRGKYTTLYEGIALLKADGFATLAEFAAHHLTEIHPSRAAYGDIAAIPSEQTGWALGLINGERILVLRGDGVGTVPREMMTRAFRV